MPSLTPLSERDLDYLRSCYDQFKEKDFLIWTYLELRDKSPASLPGTTAYFSQFQCEHDAFKELKTVFKTIDKFDYAQWLENSNKYKKNVNQSPCSMGNYEFRTWPDLFHDADNLSEYSKQQKIYERFREISTIPYQAVQQLVSPNARTFFKPQVKPLEIKIPELDRDAIRAAAEALSPYSYEHISGFGLPVQIAAAKALTAIGKHFIGNATRPLETLGTIEALMDDVRQLSPESMIQPPPSWLQKQFTSVKLIPPHETAFGMLAAKCEELPELAEQESARHRDDLKLLEHGQKVAAAYYEIIGFHAEQLAAQEERLAAENRFQTGAPAALHVRLGDLRLTQSSMSAHAMRYDQMASTVGMTCGRLGTVANVAALVQLPIMDAIQRFSVYQLKRLGEFGTNIDDAVLTQLGQNQAVLPTLSAFSREETRAGLQQSLETIMNNFEGLRSGIAITIEEWNKNIQKLLAPETMQDPPPRRHAEPITSMPEPMS